MNQPAFLASKLREPILRLLSPRSIALIGASPTPGTVGNAIFQNLLHGGFTGHLYLVNPKHQGCFTPESDHRECQMHAYVGHVTCLPKGQIDLAVIITPNTTVPGILEDLAKIEVRAVIVISAGFQESGAQGRKLADTVKAIAERSGMVLIGPNCLGLANLDPIIRMNATFAAIAPSFGRGAIFSQSGAVGIDLMNRATRLGLGIGQFVSLGNELLTGAEQLLEAWAADPEIEYLVGYVESGSALGKIRQAVQALTRQKPVLMIKAGNSDMGIQAACSHTGAMACSNTAVNALMQQSGIQRFESIDSLFAAIEAFENARPSIGNRVAIYSNAGGYGVMLSDLLEKASNCLKMTAFCSETVQKLSALLPETASIHNPVDTTATFPCDQLEAYAQGLEIVLNDPNVDACIVALIPLMSLCTSEIAKIIARMQQKYEKPIVGVLSTDELELRQAEHQLHEASLPPIALFRTIEDAVTGLNALEEHRLRKNSEHTPLPRFADIQPEQVRTIFEHVRQENRSLLTTVESLQVLDAYGIPLAPFRLVTTLEEALEAAEKMGYPVAIKLNSKTFTHKTDIGGVALDLRNHRELEKALQAMRTQLRQKGVVQFSEGEGFLIQPFIQGSCELILGAKDDPDFGKLMMLGRGGVFAQVDQDATFRLLPVSTEAVAGMVTALRAYKILQGYRGKPAVNILKLEEILARFSQLLEDFPNIQELDINPLITQPETGAIAVDTRIIIDRAIQCPIG